MTDLHINDFLVEVGTEELPPKALKELLKSFSATLFRELENAGLAYDKKSTQIFASPRRLAARVVGLAATQPDRAVEKLGPFVAQAFAADGKPTPAAAGFAKSNGVDISQLEHLPSDKGDRLVFRAMEKGRSAAELLPAMIEKALQELPIPKRMRWGASRVEFVRPVHWLVMLYGSEVIDCEILGQRAGRITRGHRFHAPGELSIATPADYQLLLRNHYVEVCFKLRRNKIVAQVEKIAAELGGKAVVGRDLLDEVTALVEWPVALAGKFEARFLQVPQEALISSMSEHQKYFHVVDAAGKLMPHFITVANIESKDPAQVIDGNERVIRPRLTDAEFFYNTDLKTPLAERREKLKTMVFQAKLKNQSTLFDKTNRLASLAQSIADDIGADRDWALRAGQLSKCDLLSSMVQEFDSMQGIAGSYYARHDKESDEVATALREQYLPKFAGDAVPETLTGCSIAIADRLDTLVAVFGIGERPTGSKDPFALRRAAIGLLNIIIKRNLDISLRSLIAASHGTFNHAFDAAVEQDVLEYILERLKSIYIEDGYTAEMFNAVYVKNIDNPIDFDVSIKAVAEFWKLPEAESLAAANKRVSNILAKNKQVIPEYVDQSVLKEDSEIALAKALSDKEMVVAPLYEKRNYIGVMTELASLREPIDIFFEKVMVMAEDEKTRLNRLAILNKLRKQFLQVADISQLVPEKK